MTMERLFVGIPLAERVRTRLKKGLVGVELPGRVVPPENWHLTVRFLGGTPAEQRERLVVSLADAELGGPLTIAFGGLGAFPRASRATVFWLGVVEGGAQLRALGARVEEVVRSAGFAPESRPVAPHLTLSRLRPPADVRPLLERSSLVGGEMRVDAVVLFRSRLGSGPARYEEVARFPLTSQGARGGRGGGDPDASS